MELYEFKSMDGVTLTQLIKVFASMMNTEKSKNIGEHLDNYHWEIGRNILHRIFGFPQNATLLYSLYGLKVETLHFMPNAIKLVKNAPENIDILSLYPVHDYVNDLIELKKYRKIPNARISNVIFSGPCTIVFWSDGDKTIVRCGDDDNFDKEKGIAMAISKKFMGTNKSKSNYCDIFKQWCSEE